jgi:two-component system, OmpR family, sensor histidine kinase SenX3
LLVAAILLALAVGFAVGRLSASAVHRPRASSREANATEPGQVQVTTVVDRLATGVVLADADGHVVYRNAAARRLAGTHAGLLIDETIERHLHQATADAPTEELLDLYGPPKMVLVVRGHVVPGNGAYVLIDDISERRRIDAVRTDFVANISHELKTPVGALAVLAETLADETDPAVVGRIVDRMLDESHRASRTIDDLLELSRIELGDEQARDHVDAADVVHGAVARAEALAERDAIRIVVAEPPAPIRLHADRRQLVSALGNLVENAVKYSEHGGLVEVSTTTDGDVVEFSVADHGVGIPARDLDRIFERFYRVDKARSRGTGGTGLGLSIVRHVATNHRGEVLVTSREGEGSTFVLRIPVTGHELRDSEPHARGLTGRVQQRGAP